MKKNFFAIIATASVLSSGAHAFTLQPGESFEYSFQSKDLTQSSNKSERYESFVTWDISAGAEGDLFLFEMFEGADFSSPLQSFNAFVGAGGVGMASPFYVSNIAWLDRDGSLRFTAGGSSLELHSINIAISTPTDSYSITVAPQAVPEVSSLALFTMGLPILAGVYFRRKTSEVSKQHLCTQAHIHTPSATLCLRAPA
nr:hypothetical protein [uncultured bacterium]